MTQKPSNAFIAASWVALGAGLFAVVSVQKSVRDRLEGIPVTDIYYGISWVSTLLAVILLTVGLWNATLLPSEKGFYAFSFLLALFGAIAVQKNTRDSQQAAPKKDSTNPVA